MKDLLIITCTSTVQLRHNATKHTQFIVHFLHICICPYAYKCAYICEFCVCYLLLKFLYMKHIVGKTKSISGNEKAWVFNAKFACCQNVNERYHITSFDPFSDSPWNKLLFITICLIFSELCVYFVLLISKLHCVTQGCH